MEVVEVMQCLSEDIYFNVETIMKDNIKKMKELDALNITIERLLDVQNN